MGVRPLNDKVLIKRVEAPEKTKGGIIIPDTANEKPQEGEVVAVGKGKVLENGTTKPLDVKKGDRVLFGKYGGTEINFKGDDFIILDETDILAVIDT
jgi:chaperonin GroES